MSQKPVELIGPIYMSDQEIERTNAGMEQSWKGHRLMGILPLTIVCFLTWAFLTGDIGAVQFWVTSVPLALIGAGALLLRPYRLVKRIEVSGEMDEQGLRVKVRINRERPRSRTLNWSDVVGFELEDKSCVFYQRSGEQWRVPVECFTSEAQRSALSRLIEKSIGRSVLLTS